jgi:flavin-binding protein dodecin
MTESATYKIVEIAGTSPESIAEGVAALFAVWA